MEDTGLGRPEARKRETDLDQLRAIAQWLMPGSRECVLAAVEEIEDRRLLSASIIRCEVWRIAANWLNGDFGRAQGEVKIYDPVSVSGERQRLFVKWGDADGEIEYRAEDRALSLDQFSVMFLEPLVQRLAAHVFPAPANEDR